MMMPATAPPEMPLDESSLAEADPLAAFEVDEPVVRGADDEPDAGEEDAGELATAAAEEEAVVAAARAAVVLAGAALVVVARAAVVRAVVVGSSAIVVAAAAAAAVSVTANERVSRCQHECSAAEPRRAGL